MSDLVAVPVIACPLCQSRRVRIVSESPNLFVCACDACRAQFTVSPSATVYIERRKTPRQIPAS